MRSKRVQKSIVFLLFSFDTCLTCIRVKKTGQEMRLRKCLIYKRIFYSVEYAAPIWSPYSKLQINQIEKAQRTAAHWTCRRWRNTSSVGEMLARTDRSSLFLFHKIHYGAVSIEKDEYLTPAHSLKTTKASHSAQYCEIPDIARGV